LAIHENVQEALSGLEAEDLTQQALGVVDVRVVLVGAYLVRLVVGIDDLRHSHANIPEHLWCAGTLVAQLCDDHVDDLIDGSLDELWLKQEALVKLFLFFLDLFINNDLVVTRFSSRLLLHLLLQLLLENDEVLGHESQGSYRTGRHLLFVALLVLRVLDACVNQQQEVLLLPHLLWHLLRVNLLFRSFSISPIRLLVLLIERLALYNTFNRIQAGDKGYGPGIADLYVDVGLAEYRGAQAMATDSAANIFVLGEDTRSSLVLDQVAECFDDGGLQNRWNWIEALHLLWLLGRVLLKALVIGSGWRVCVGDIEHLFEEVEEPPRVLLGFEDSVILLLVHDAN